ncbi:MAG: AAA family ATPase [Corynebacterium sp.]|nr:AAA family ATPase [Corynebacterium sp.]
MTELDKQLAAEQAYVDDLFGRIDSEVQTANERLKEVMLRVDRANPDPEDLVRRETEYHSLNAKLDRLTIAQLGLVFGRIDIEAEEPENPVANSLDPEAPLDRRYIGRMGIDDRENHYKTLLLDWRAPMARAFYLATTAHPEGVHVRRHIRTKGRTVTGIDDEVLVDDPSAESTTSGVASESALMHALNRARTEHMSSIVETIQREQDDIIRDQTRGVMVVEGGPGTGKTAVALHRVAYLLYTWREHLEKRGVLIIGPNKTFLEYISRVLPELGETGVVLATVGDLYPGISTTRQDSLLVREVKGSDEMVTIMTEAVKLYQTTPAAKEPVKIQVDGITLTLDSKIVAAARTRARRSRQKHNLAQPIFTEALTELLAQQMAGIIGKDLLTPAQIDALQDDLLADEPLIELIHSFWPILNPEQVLADLYSDQGRIAKAAKAYDETTQEALFREDSRAWSISDIALLDELATIIGTQADEEDKEKNRANLDQAEDALDALISSASIDSEDEVDNEILSAHDVIDAETLASRQEERDNRTTAQRAAADVAWAYGHVIVDEAQELSAMEWRMVMRRCPSRWMTLVGDIAQTSSPAGVEDWKAALSPFVQSRFRQHLLTVNYRTPEEIMEVANELLPVIAPEQKPATAIRQSGIPVSFIEDSTTDPEGIAAQLRATDPDRTVAIITAQNIESHKGLEFDHIIVVKPQDFLEESPQGWQDLYVALTRATQSLTVIGAMPE